MKTSISFSGEMKPSLKLHYFCSAVPYTIKVETGPDKDGGTSANAYIEITGEGEKNTTGKLPLILLDPDASFAPGMTDTFSIQAPDVKQIKQITVSFNFKAQTSAVYGSAAAKQV